MTMREGKVVAWPRAVGAPLEKGETVVVIESEKAEFEVEAAAQGVLRAVFVEAGQVVPCGTLLGAITPTADQPFDALAFRREAPRAEAPPASRATHPGAGGAKAQPAQAAATRAHRSGAGLLTPAARSLARQLGIDPAQVPGTGPGGRVTREDVAAWAERRRDLVPVAGGVALEVPREGSGEPVVLLPGFGTDVAAFARQTPVLAERFRVLGVNPRGVGGSDAPQTEHYDVAVAAADVVAVLASLAEGSAGGAAPAAHVVGASLGAAVAIELAIAHPERVRSLTLITPFVVANARLLAVLDAWCHLAAEASPDSLARALLPWLFSGTLLGDARATERTTRGLAEIASRVPATTLERSAAGLRRWSGRRATELARIGVPTLVVAGADDLLTPGARGIADAIPGAGCLVVPDAGHAVALEAPDAVNTALLEHLTRST